MSRRQDLASRFLGGMVGSALGDAIGELAFRFRGEAQLRARIEASEQLVYTDDTAMAVALAESLAEVGDVDPRHLGDTFRAHYRREPWRGYASGPPTIFALVERSSLSYLAAARSLFGGQGSFGNGAAMRIAPLGLFYHGAPDLYDRARAATTVTHAHPIGVDGAAVLARAIGLAVELDPAQGFSATFLARELVEYARTPELKQKLEVVQELLAGDASPATVAGELGRSVAMHESLPFALYAFLRYPQSFEACLFCAILNGGDRDTLGAMACAVSGAYLGIEAIPPAWRARLENREHIEELALKLADRAAARSRPPT